MEALVVNDEPAVLTALTMMLKREFQVHAFGDAISAWDFLESHGAVTVAILDLYMPKVNGWDLARILNTADDPEIRAMPVVICSSVAGGPDLEVLCKENGALGLLPFPLPPEDFLKQLWELLGGKDGELGKVLIYTTPVATPLGRSLQELLGHQGFQADHRSSPEGLEGRHDVYMLTDDFPPEELQRMLDDLRAENSRAVALVFSQDSSSERVYELNQLGADLVINYQVDALQLMHLIRRERRRRELYHTYGYQQRR